MLYTPYRYKKPKKKKQGIDEVLETFEVFKKEAKKNGKQLREEIKAATNAFKIPQQQFMRMEDVQAAIVGLTKKQGKQYLSLLVKRGRISRRQKKAAQRLNYKSSRGGKKKSARRRVPTKYNAYIKSEHWRSRRNRYWQEHPRRCAVCNTGQHLHLHHMVYDSTTYGDEPDAYLVGLCETHHDQYHKQHGTQQNMIKQTMAFVEAAKKTAFEQLRATLVK